MSQHNQLPGPLWPRSNHRPQARKSIGSRLNDLAQWPPLRYLTANVLSSQEAAELAAKSHAPGNARERDALHQALDLQLALHQTGLMLALDVPACASREERARVGSAIASIAKGWQSMNDQVRILKGKPLPGSLRPQSQPKRKAKQDSVAPMSDTPKESLS